LRVSANGIELEVEIEGQEDARPLLLIAGLGGTLVTWDDEFCHELAERGHRAIRYDARDMGRSTILSHLGPPDVEGAMAAAARGEQVPAPYDFGDMADDAAALLDALGIDAAHVAGRSMGGMVAQVMAIRHPTRVLSLTSIMSTTGNRDLPPPTAEAVETLMRPKPEDRDGHVQINVENERALAGSGFPFEEAFVRRREERSFDRGFDEDARARQLVASITSGDRREALSKLQVPTLVIHGTEDSLVVVEGGIDTANAVPGARLELIRGMGHALPRGAWPQILNAISELTRSASGRKEGDSQSRPTRSEAP
jgi:pimeloyl-ACP methyl ester carboxylesterase